ncbi:conserved hypothetical protein [Paraburkholderia caribensis]|nr:conserved hypothetical protein [Paraburkholderia caribensis]
MQGGAQRSAGRVAVRNISLTYALRMLGEDLCMLRDWKDFACIRKRS